MSTILGPDGLPLVPVVKDYRVTYANDGEVYSAAPLDILSAAARMQRDGWSLERIRNELDLIRSGPGEVTLDQLQRAITNFGMPELRRRIRMGEEPAESVVVEFELAGGEEEELDLGEPVPLTTEEFALVQRQIAESRETKGEP